MSRTITSPDTEDFVTVSGLPAEVRRGGRGRPLLVLHGELGIPGWTRALNDLSTTFAVVAPSLPGFGRSECPEWIMSIDDLATWTVSCIEALELEQPLSVVASSMGAWIAMHLAAVNRTIFDRMVLVNPVGVKPPDGEIWDYFYYTAKDGFARAFNDLDSPEYVEYYGRDWTVDESEQAERNREMACRLVWKPYMWSYTTRGRVQGIRTPTLVVVSSGDRIVPNSLGHCVHQTIAGSQYRVIEDAGHLVEMERPDQFAAVVREFLGQG